jgi:hypothetical protein
MERTDGSAPREAVYLVERYWPEVDEALLRSALPRLELAARAMTEEGRLVQHVGTLFMAADQVVFSVIRAGSEELARQLSERADMPVDRIAEVSVHGFDVGGAGAAGWIDQSTEP